MSLLSEYINKKFDIPKLENELINLIKSYNKLRDSYLFIYSAAVNKPIPGVGIEQSDFYVFYDLLSKKTSIKNIDIYLETPGGSGEATEEIVRFLRKDFEKIAFVVCGEAKSAGTIMVLSGDEIFMTETGSLGPIDAQIKIGRSFISAYDYMDWVKIKRKDAKDKGELNPFDATMVAQITPGEIGTVFHSLEFAKDLVKKWLVDYKFKNWNTTAKRKIQVTSKMKQDKAEEISIALTDQSKWRSHGRSIKIDDLENIGLKINKIENDPTLADIVFRIKTVITLLFDMSTIFKIFATEDTKIFRTGIQTNQAQINPKIQATDVIAMEPQCPKCSKIHKIFIKLNPDPKIDDDLKKKGYIPFPKDGKFKCECGFELDLSSIKNQIEIDTGKKAIIN